MAKYKHWDLDRLMDAADAFDVAERMGMRMKRYGGSTYGECVSGSHKETQINHMQIFRDGCKCYSCGAAHNTYGMVKNYFANVVGRSLDHDEICSLIAETCGGEEQYIIHPQKSNGKVKKPFPLTDEELAFLNLVVKAPRPRAILSFSEYKTEDIREFCDDGYAKTAPLPPMNIYTLFRENEELFWQIIRGKVYERIAEAQAGYKSYKETDKVMVQFFIDLYNKGREFENKFFPNQKQKVS